MACMHCRVHRPVVALLVAWSLACPAVPAQNSPNGSAPDEPQALVKPDAKRAKMLAQLGAKEEAAGAYEQALAAYEEAVRYAPFDVTLVSKETALRNKLIKSYMENAERLSREGDFSGATRQIGAALHLDPSNAALLERLQKMESKSAEKKGLPAEEPPEGLVIAAPEKVKKSFHLQTDLRSAFEQVTAEYGMKASFDPDLPARSVRLRLEDVDFDTAMKVLTEETETFWTALGPKLIFVASDTSEKRKAYQPEIEKTFVLPSSVSATEIADVVKVVRDLTGAQKVHSSLAAHTLTIRDTVQRVELAGAIIRDLERAPGEVLLEIDLLEVDRNDAVQYGITPPASLNAYSVPPNLVAALHTAPSLSALLTLLASIFGTAATSGLSTLSSTLPPIVAFGGGKSTFLLTLPTFTADFSKSLSLVRSGRQVLLDAQEGKPATFFAGERYPITLSLLSGSLGNSTPVASVGATGVSIQSEQFTVGRGPVALAMGDLRSSGNQDVVVANEVDNSLTVLLNQGAGAVSQFAQATGSPISLGPSSTSTSTGVVSPAATLTVSTATLVSMAVTPATATLAAGGTQQFTAIGTFSDGSTQNISSNVTWSSTNTAVATIGTQTGLAVCQGSGTTQITATLGTLTSNTATLTGTSATLQSIAITPTTGSLARNGTLHFLATGTFSDGSLQNVTTSATWHSSSTNIATIGVGSGLARGISAGSTQITATVGSVVSPAITLTVTSATLKSIAVTPATPTIAIGTSQQFAATGTYSDGSTQDVTSSSTWASSSTSVATISASAGMATAVAAGTTSITAAQGGAGAPVGVAIGSLDTATNSIPDLVVASQITNTVTVLLGNGDGTFSSPGSAVTYTVGNQPSAIALGTFNTNANTNLGFVVTNFADNSYSVFTGNGDGTFTQVAGSPFHLPSGQTGPIAIDVDDFNQDGIPDLAIVNESSNNVTVLQGNGNGTFTAFPGSPLAVGNFPVAIDSGSLAGSTGPGLAIANQKDNTLSVYLGNGNGTFVAASQSPLATDSTPSGVAIADLAGTDTGGIAVTNTGSGTVTIFVDLGSGLFTNALEPAAGTDPGAILAGDFTSSTFPDILVANDLSGTDGLVTLLVSPTSVVSSSSIAQEPYPGSEYEDIGLKIKATPYLHANNEVTLVLDYEIKSLAGTNVNGIPIITNRAMTQTVRLKENETSIISGLLDQEETKSLTGIPGLARIPGAGNLFGSTNNSYTDDELLILVTPRKLRMPDRESRAIYAGRGDVGGRGAVGGGAAEPIPPVAEPHREEPRPERPTEPAEVPPATPEQPPVSPPAQPPTQPVPEERPNEQNPTPPPTRPE